MDLVFAGKLKVAMDKTYHIHDAITAQKRLESGRQMGKITLTFSLN
jgi:NADPH:quinone reductase-like Zn-dependent oxidoreductase